MSQRYDSSYRENYYFKTNTQNSNPQNTNISSVNNNSILPFIISGIIGVAGQALCAASQPVQSEASQPESSQPEQSREKLENKVLDILGNKVKNFDRNSEYFNDVVNKYDAMKAVNPNISDAEAERRLENYINALERKKQEQQMIDADITDPKTLEMEVVDKNMTPETMKDGNAYIKALYNRGEGELAIYDSNGDNQVNEEEFIKAETGKTKAELSRTDEGNILLEAALKSFMKYDINRNKVLTADELGAASYATYRLSDYDENGNEISKTGNSMGYDEYLATVAILTGATEPGDPDRKNFTNLQLGAYEMLKNYKP